MAPQPARTDNADNVADDLAVIDLRNTAHLVRQQELKTGELCVGEPEMTVGGRITYMLEL